MDGKGLMFSKKLLSTLLLVFLFAAACSQTVPGTGTPAGTQSSSTNTGIPADTQSPSTVPIARTETENPAPQAIPPTETHSPPTEAAGPTALPGTLAPQSQSDCTDSASFVTDVTVPDNTKINQGKGFLKSWRIRNTGTCSWNDNYSMVFVHGDQMNSVAAIPLKATAPGATLDVSADLVAPSADGAYTGNYELQNAAGKPFLIDNTRLIWVKIIVGTGFARQQTPVAGNTSETQTPVAGTSGNCTFFEDSQIERTLISLINSARADNGLQALKFNKKLSGAAIGHSIDMACHSNLSHSGSNGSFITDRFNANGYSYTYWNEAIYAQPPEYGGSAQSAVDWWLNDPPHRVILLSPDAKDIGSGYAYVSGSKLGGYFTIDVGATAP
jgi:uncharacterized protein YkwD